MLYVGDVIPVAGSTPISAFWKAHFRHLVHLFAVMKYAFILATVPLRGRDKFDSTAPLLVVVPRDQGLDMRPRVFQGDEAPGVEKDPGYHAG
ncbi:MAG: hypothetical protein HY080_14670 [Gammaproteobacteria bacterium]|nr:hypothetical protein [Gammaproteobacteria bacterium]